MYDNIYMLIEQYIFSGSIITGSYQELVAISLSSIACIFLFALPFIIVWRIIKVWF